MSLYECESKVKVALQPHCIGKPRSGVEKQLNRSLYRYSDELDGVPMSYSLVNFVPDQHARVLNESAWLHFDVVTNVLVFKPRPGDLIQGTVSFVSEQNVALLCYGIFNASISAHELGASYTYSEDKESWEGDDAVIAEGDVMTFKIGRITSNRGIVSMDGALTVDQAQKSE